MWLRHFPLFALFCFRFRLFSFDHHLFFLPLLTLSAGPLPQGSLASHGGPERRRLSKAWRRQDDAVIQREKAASAVALATGPFAVVVTVAVAAAAVEAVRAVGR